MAEMDLGKVVGRSAYEIAVENGFEGNEQEWLESLKGQPGQDAEEYEVLTSSESVQGNTEPGKLVDALVIKEVFQSVSEGKEAIASAITDKGVQTDADTSFAIMAENIGQIQSGGGGSTSGSETISFNYSGVFSDSTVLNLRSYFPEKKIQKIILKQVKLSGKKELSNASSSSIRFELYAKKSGNSQEVSAAYFYHSISSTSYTNTQKQNIEIDMSEYDCADYIKIYTPRGYGTVYYYDFVAEGEIEVYY